MRDRLLWSVLFTGADPRVPPVLLSEGWCPARRALPTASGVPTRALLFCTRAQARAWCAERMRTWQQGDHITRAWRVRAVRVSEKVAPA